MVFTRFTEFTLASFQSSQAAIITTARYPVTTSWYFTSQAACVFTIMSIKPFRTLCESQSVFISCEQFLPYEPGRHACGWKKWCVNDFNYKPFKWNYFSIFHTCKYGYLYHTCLHEIQRHIRLGRIRSREDTVLHWCSYHSLCYIPGRTYFRHILL